MAGFRGDNFIKHQRAWCRFWRAWAANNGVDDPWAYDVAAGCSCLSDVQDGTAKLAIAGSKPEQHSTFKEARAAMSAFWGIVHQGTNFAEEHAVKLITRGLVRDAPLLKAYSDTWDVDLVFNKVFVMAAAGDKLTELPHYEMRAWLVMLIKLRTKCRSGDLGHVHVRRDVTVDCGGLYRGFYPAESKGTKRCGLYGNFIEGEVKKIRFFRNKTSVGNASLYTAWHPLGAYLENTAALPHLSAACPRRLLERYLDITDSLSRADDLVLVSKLRKRGQDGRLRHHGLNPQTVAHDAGHIMTLCGVPERFKPHSSRHASLSDAVGSAGGSVADEADVLKTANLSSKVFRLFYDQPVAKDQLSAAAPLPASRRARKTKSKDDKSAPTAKTKTVTTPPVDANAASEDDDGDQEWEASAIDGEDSDGEGGRQFQVHWVGFPTTTWEPEANLGNASALISAFRRRRAAATALKHRRLAASAPPRVPTASVMLAPSTSSVPVRAPARRAVHDRGKAAMRSTRATRAGSSFVLCTRCGKNVTIHGLSFHEMDCKGA